MKRIPLDSISVLSSPEYSPIDGKSKLSFEANESPSPTPNQNPAKKHRRLSSHMSQRTASQSPIFQRGRGRPIKKSQDGVPISVKSSNVKPASNRSGVVMRREYHNDSAMRSREKFNSALDELWQEMPETVRSQASGQFAPRKLSRADKVEVAISYIRNVRSCVENRKS